MTGFETQTSGANWATATAQIKQNVCFYENKK